MASPMHRANILNPRFRAAGLGILSGTPRLNARSAWRHLRRGLRLPALGAWTPATPRDDAPVRRLITIPISHYCEKARWALERAGLDYAEERHVQGISIFVARRAGGGETMPVLVADEGVFGESEQILRYADERLDEEGRLFPADPPLRDEVVELSRWLDEGLGPDGRRLMYAHMLTQRRQMLRVNNQGVPAWEDRVMTALWPLATRLASRRLGIGPTTLAGRRAARDAGLRRDRRAARGRAAGGCAGIASRPRT